MSGKPCKGPSYHHILRVVGLGCPVWDAPHAALSIAKLLAEGSILGLGVPAAVGVMESHVEEERPECGGGVSMRVKARPLS